MFYIANRKLLKNVNMLTAKERRQAILSRPTPWRVFLGGFVHCSPQFGLVWLSEENLEHFYNKTRALFYAWQVLCINGDEYSVSVWNFFDMCKFCIESFQYGLFLKFWEWRW